MATVAELNRVASQTHRKRPRASDFEDGTPQKRQAIEYENEPQRGTEAQSTARRSATRLQNRSNLPITTPISRPRGRPRSAPTSTPRSRGRPSKVNVQETPGQNAEDKTLAEKPQEEKQPTKKKRVLNRKGDKKPMEAKTFDKHRPVTINPLTTAGVTLSTFDSPAKNTRAKKAGSFKKLSLQNLKPTSVDVESDREASPELGFDGPQEDLPTSGQLQDDVESDDNGEQANPDETQKSTNDIIAEREINGTDGEDEDVVNVDGAIRDESDENGLSWTQPTTEQDRNYIRKEYEDNEKEQRRKKKESKPKPQESVSESQAVKGQQSNTRHGTQPENVEDGEHTESDEEQADIGTHGTQAEPAKKRRRPKMSEEERTAQKEAAAQKRQENAMETEEAELRKFNSRAKEFVDDIGDLVIQVGGLKAWSYLGAGAKTITGVVVKKQRMNEPRAQNLWKKLSHLKDIFSGREEAEEERVSHLINSLKAKSTWSFLTRNEEIKREDTTVLDLYEQLIPQSVYVLKKALKGRFVAVHKVSWQELQSLTEIAIGLCDVASSWQPRPVSLEAGIRREVRLHIRPNLTIIQNVINNTLNQMEWQEKRKRELTAFAKRQELKREEKRIAWERLNSGCPSYQMMKSAGHTSRGATERATEDVEWIEDTNVIQAQQVASTFNSQTRPQSLLRRPTEEIPAPDPNITWSEKENVALLNGLQMYLNEDRYRRILGDPGLTKVLSEKDIDQCMAQAKFYQAGCHQVLKEMAVSGDTSFDWLRTV